MADETKIIKIEIDTGPTEQAAISIKSLTDANRKLREERKLLDITTDDGRKRIDAINASLDRNDKLIKQNSSSLEKQRLNVGNYTNSIKDAVPFLDKFTSGAVSSAQGIAGMAKSSLAFLATPIGAAIGAIGLAIGALTQYINGSDEAGDRFAKTTAALGFVFEKLKIIVENVGGFIFDTIEFIAGGVEKVIGFLNPAAGAAIEAARKAGEELANLQDDIENRENAALVRRAEVNERVQQLREQAITQEGALKRATIEEAIRLEKELAAEETKLAQDKVAAFRLENKERIENQKLSGDQLRELSELEADVINQRSAGSQATIKFQKEVEKLREAEIKQLNEISNIAFQNDINEVKRQQEIQDEYNKSINELTNLIAKVDEYNQIVDLSGELATANSLAKEEEADAEKAYQAEIKKTSKELKITDDQRKANVQSAIALSATVIGLGEAESKAAKGLALGTIAVNSAIGVSNAVKAGSGLVWPANLAAILSGVTAVLAGISQAKGFLGFAEGGFTGEGSKYQVAGLVHAGEFVVPQETVRAYGPDYFASRYLPGYADGGYVTNQSVQSTNEQIGIMRALRSMPAPILTYREFSDFTNRVSLKESITTA
jgi:hypothetical protein